MWHLWTARVALVVGNVATLSFTIALALLHLVFLNDSALGIGLNQLGASTQRFVVPVIVAMATASAIHVLVLLYSVSPTRHLIDRLIANLVALARRKRMARMRPTVPTIVPANSSVSSERLASLKALAVTARGRLASITTTASGRLSSFKAVGNHPWWSRHSGELTRLVMLWEVGLQTFQAYKISYLVASVSINRLVALVIVTNCWFAPILHYVMGNRPMKQVQLGHLMLDSSLDLIYSIFIPLAIFYPYYRDYDGSVSLYPTIFYYDDIWYVNAVSELRQVFVTSWLDFVSKVSGCLSLVFHLWRLKSSVDDLREVANVAASSVTSAAKPTRLSSCRLSRLLDLVLVLWGATIFSLHLTTTITSLRFYDPDCLLEMRPWGSLAYSCASFEISCSKRHTTGDHETMEAILTAVDPQSVQNLILSNCAQLHVPPGIQTLKYLTTLKIYNSTIASWGTQAALRQQYHPQLQMVFLPRVNMSGIPDGLLADDFPSSVWDIELCITNMTTLPSTITTPWANVGCIVYEGNPQLTEYPEVLVTLPHVFALFLGMNNIQTIRGDVFKNLPLMGISMNGNPIDHLPDSIGSLDQLAFLNFMETKIAAIPASWMDMAVPAAKGSGSVVLYAVGSPLCASQEATQLLQPSWLRINCELPPEGMYEYPIHAEDAWRRANH